VTGRHADSDSNRLKASLLTMRSRTSHSDVILPTLHVSLPGGQISFMEDLLQNVCAGSGGVKQDTSRFDFLPRFVSATHPFEQFFSNFLNAGIWIKLNTPFATRALANSERDYVRERSARPAA
jgi:hypothetical protein